MKIRGVNGFKRDCAEQHENGLRDLLLIPAVLFILMQRCEIAIQAKSIMTAYRPATSTATPLCLFFFQEALDALLFDEFEIIYHAHMVLGVVALIEGFQPTTGKISTLIAKPDKPFPEQIALFLHEGAILTAWQAAGAVGLIKSLLI